MRFVSRSWASKREPVAPPRGAAAYGVRCCGADGSPSGGCWFYWICSDGLVLKISKFGESPKVSKAMQKVSRCIGESTDATF